MANVQAKSWGSRAFEAANDLLLLLLSFTVVYPFIYILMLSISGRADVMSVTFSLVPKDVTLTSYQIVLSSPAIWRALYNSVFRTLAGTFLGVAMTALAAYPLSKRYLPHRGLFTFLIFFTMLFGGGLIPSYLLIKELGLLDSRWSLIIPGVVNAFHVIVMRKFFQGMPEDLEEAARIDGASELTVLLRIVLPLSMPILATVGLWLAVGHWNSWFDAMIYINNPNKQVLAVILRQIVVRFQMTDVSGGIAAQQARLETRFLNYTPESVRAATIMVTIVPIILVYPFLQRYFVKGVMVGSLKG